MTKLKVGIIGCGGIAQGVHIPNYLKLHKTVEIAAVCDVSMERAKACSEKYHIKKYFSDFKEMIDNADIEAVSVCVPNKFHAEATIYALHAGCHVICEKPPAINVQEAKEMANAAKTAGKILTYGFHYRHSNEVQAIKRFIENNELGDIYAAKSVAVRRRGIPGWGVFTNKELQGGGSIIDIGVHMLDTTLYLMGYPEPDMVLGKTYQKLGNRKGVGLMGEWDWENFSVEDMGRGMIIFKNGASIILETAFAANVQKDETMQVSLMGDKGGADVFPVQIYQEKHGSLIDIHTPYLEDKDYYELEFERFVNGCLNKDTPISKPEEGVILQQIIDALYESSYTGEAVKIK
ncbi:Gfo/Idh/MocA family protein [Gracilibacillus alcaliphilus]|uniref:Gfo/Idh/MocA family protein n=1 Tax=Gracilibacillus alcaliphilus TaxID=1401441 RepID=UPI001EF8852E|nr:Gfo/Idh/MocA family oxidoreductase [Gracilibacillus alcaliphilus]MBM7676826.1 putative dehydrogenase [Gracilibacillus alcaliphilus]